RPPGAAAELEEPPRHASVYGATTRGLGPPSPPAAASGHASDRELPDRVALERQQVVTRGAVADPRDVLSLQGHLDGDDLAAARAGQGPNGGDPLLVHRPPPFSNLSPAIEEPTKIV